MCAVRGLRGLKPIAIHERKAIVKKLLAVMLCLGLVCGMSMGLVGCTEKKAPPPATKDKDAKDKDAKEKDAKEKDAKEKDAKDKK